MNFPKYTETSIDISSPGYSIMLRKFDDEDYVRVYLCQPGISSAELYGTIHDVTVQDVEEAVKNGNYVFTPPTRAKLSINL